jgi:hypothetical protein
MAHRRLALLWPALLLLASPPRTALADLIIHDPVVGATTATDNGVPVAVDPALTINISTRFLTDGTVNWSVFPSLPGPNNYGPVWIAAVEDGSVYCDFSGCGSGRFGWHNIGGPMDANPDFGGLSLGGSVGRQVVVERTTSGTTLTIIDPPSLFDLLELYFAGTITIWELFDGIADALPQHSNMGRRKRAASNG